MKQPLHLFAPLLLTALLSTGQAAEIHFTPEGAGKKDGTSWTDALPAQELQTSLHERAKPGDRILLGSGTYSRLPHSNNTLLIVSKGGAKGSPLTIEGVDTGDGIPLIQGKWKESNVRYHAHSSTAISLRTGVSHLTIRNLRIARCMHGITTSGDNGNIRMENIVVGPCREGFVFKGLTASTLSRCRIAPYTKRGIRFETGCQNLTLSEITSDATAGDPSWPVEAFPFGFSIEDDSTNRTIHFERCVARNNIHASEPGEYWNGDGFVAESSAREIRYTNCSAFDNTDGGWDDKSLAPVFENCIAARNKRGFRIWNLDGNKDHPARLTNCLSVFNASRGGSGSSVGLWTRGVVHVDRSTFHNNATAAFGIENNQPGGDVTATRCILSADASVKCESLVLKEGSTRFQGKENILWHRGEDDESPSFKSPSQSWDGSPPDAFDSNRYKKEKGYAAGP